MITRLEALEIVISISTKIKAVWMIFMSIYSVQDVRLVTHQKAQAIKNCPQLVKMRFKNSKCHALK